MTPGSMSEDEILAPDKRQMLLTPRDHGHSRSQLRTGSLVIRPRLDARTRTERPHVLIVTDDESLGSFLTEGLPLGGFWTSIIASGLQALEVFNLRQFDLIVVDGGLQTFGAMEFLRRLRGTSTRDRNARARSGAPAVLIGLETDRPSDADIAGLGIAAFLSPPLELDEIVRHLHLVFDVWRSAHPDTPLADEAALRNF